MTEQENSTEQLLTIKEIARIEQNSEKTIRRRLAAGLMPYIQIGRMLRIRPEDHRTYLEKHRKK